MSSLNVDAVRTKVVPMAARLPKSLKFQTVVSCKWIDEFQICAREVAISRTNAVTCHDFPLLPALIFILSKAQ